MRRSSRTLFSKSTCFWKRGRAKNSRISSESRASQSAGRKYAGSLAEAFVSAV